MKTGHMETGGCTGNILIGILFVFGLLFSSMGISKSNAQSPSSESQGWIDLCKGLNKYVDSAPGIAALLGLSKQDCRSIQGVEQNTCLDPRHVYLRNTGFTSPAVTDALKSAGATRQVPNEDSIVPIKYDEFSVVVKKMPPSLTPEQYLAEMATDLNKAVNSHGTVPPLSFDSLNIFTRRASTPSPAVGNIYDINILGPDDGDVILVEKTPSHFVFHAVSTKDSGKHPENGIREFGFERNPDGSVTFYTRGVSQASLTRSESADYLGDLAGAYFQGKGWTRMMEGISDEMNRRGDGTNSDKSSVAGWKKDLLPSDEPAKYLCKNK